MGSPMEPVLRHRGAVALAAVVGLAAAFDAAACEPLAEARLVLTKLHRPSADDRFVLRGRLAVPSITALAGVAMASGLGITLDDDAHGIVVDVRLPPGTYETATRRGWRMREAGFVWRWTDKNPAPPGGIRRAKLEYEGKDDLGRMVVSVLVKGHGVAYATDLEPEATVTLDPDAGPCFRARFAGEPGSHCRRVDGGTIRCR
jgi:hypothetical protein